MKLFLDKSADQNIISAYGTDHVKVNQTEYRENLIVATTALETDWAKAGFDGLTDADFAYLAEFGAEIILIGTGARQRFPAPALLRPLMAARVGFEVMDLGSACRTYNILAHEGRSVAAALIVEPA